MAPLRRLDACEQIASIIKFLIEQRSANLIFELREPKALNSSGTKMSAEPTQILDTPDKGNLHAFLVEQDPVYISIVSQLFSEIEDCRLKVFSGGSEVFPSIDRQLPDLIIFASNQGIAGQTTEHVAEIRKKNESLYLIVSSETSNSNSVSAYLRAGADDCVSRIENFLPELIASIRRGLRHILKSKPFLLSSLSRSAHFSFPDEVMEPLTSRMLEPGQVISHYRILAEIGQGGMGEVYKAEDLRLGRSVAIKVLPRRIIKHENARQRLISEARSASALNHPNIVTIHSIEEWEGLHFIVMEYVEGQSLAALVTKDPLPIPLLLDVGLLLAEALAAAHSIGVIHRDIKPGNIMITDRGVPKLLDFGLAKRPESGDSMLSVFPSLRGTPSHVTVAGQIMGTVSYMSPEQTRGEALDGRSDAFSLACTLYQAATCRLPFDGLSPASIVYEIGSNDPIPPTARRPELPAEFDAIIANAFAKDRDQRWTAQDVAIAFRKLKTSYSERLSGKTEGPLIAVLYFENLGGAAEEEYFRDGMTEDIITELSKIKNLRILPRSAVISYRDRTVTPQQIGNELRASFILAGSVRRAGTRVRITTQLLHTGTGHSEWAEGYDRELRDVLDIQQEIARSIAQALRITLTPQEEKEIARKPTDNLQAYDYYLRGRSFVRRATLADLEFAMQMFERAIELESQFAMAYAGLSNVCALFYDWYKPEDEWIQKGLDAANASLALEPDLPEGLAARARIFWAQRRYEDAVQHARLALQRKRDCEGAYWTLGQALFSQDRWQETADLAEQALESSGDDYNVYIPLVNALGRLGKNEDEARLRQKHNSVLQQQLQWVPEDVRARMLLATNYAFFNHREEAVRELQKAVSLRPFDANLLYNAACAYGIMQMKEEAFAMLKESVLKGFWNMEWVVRDPDLKVLNDDPEFLKFLEEHRRTNENSG